MRLIRLVVATLACLGSLGAAAHANERPIAPGAIAHAALAPGEPSPLALESPFVAGRTLAAADEASAPAGGGLTQIGLTPDRARILLRSLTLPGWGQATLGRRTSSAVFLIAEAGVWGSFTAFQIQNQLRRQSAERTARLFAGIDLSERDEEYRRIVGSYLSSDEYNLFVVYRDAANQFYDDPVAYRAYIEAHSIGGKDSWEWQDVESLLRYRAQRKAAHRASIRANTALACAIGNRLLSAIHAARAQGQSAAAPRSWNLEIAPVPGQDATAFTFGVRTRF